MLNDMSYVEILGSWLPSEKLFEEKLGKHKKVRLLYMEPFWSLPPWTKALEGKDVLVVHPFAETIEMQYEKRKFLFKNNILPDFKLHTIKAVQSLAGTKTDYSDWFEALESMKQQMNNINYDICLIGAGAYGFPLAAHAKRSGKKAVHLGGSLQLLFGIKGKRWENPEYGKASGVDYSKLINEYWVRPHENDKLLNATVVENACYW